MKENKHGIDPRIELKRHVLITTFFDNFVSKCVGNSTELTVWERNKYHEILAKFIWKNISDNDPVIPFNDNGVYDTEQLIIDVNNKGIDGNKIVQSFDFSSVFKNMTMELNGYISECKKSEPSSVRYAEKAGMIFYEKHGFSLHQSVKNNLDKWFNDNGIGLNRLVLYFCVVCRYDILDGKNNQLSVLPKFKQKIKDVFGVNFELFGSCMNRSYDGYCSLFYDLEQYFGSKGNFFDFDIRDGIYLMNPPFDEDIMERGMKKIMDKIKKKDSKVAFIITIPVWDAKMSLELSKKCGTKFQDMGRYAAYEVVHENEEYIADEKVYCKNDFPYYDFKKNKVINASNTYVILVKSKLMDLKGANLSMLI